jgi:hypothetical protein
MSAQDRFALQMAQPSLPLRSHTGGFYVTSRRAKKRAMIEQASHTSVNAEVKHAERPDWPRFYRLYEHSRFHTVLCLPSMSALLDVENMMQKGNAMCTHTDELGDCIHIERTSIEEWLATHPGEP